MALTDQMLDLLRYAQNINVEISELTVSESQAKQLAAECGVAYLDGCRAPTEIGSHNSFAGVRLIVRPEPLTPNQRAAKNLRELADQLEKEDKQ